MSTRVTSTRDSHSETMVKKLVRAEVGLLRDDWFVPVLSAALDKALTYVGSGHDLHWREAGRKAVAETYEHFGISGIQDLVGSAPEALEAGEAEGGSS